MQDAQDGFNLACNDRLFLGESLFETIKVQEAKPCFSELHWQRISNSAKSLGQSFIPFKDWQQLLLEKIQQEQLIEGGIKAIWTGGEAPRTLIAQGQHNQLLLQCFSYELIRKPVRLIFAPWLRDLKNPIYQLKTINYLEAILARRKARQEGADDALFFNTQGQVTEATCANIFFIYQEKIITPSLKDGVLPGITRFRVLNHCQKLNIAYEETSINKKLIQAAAEKTILR